MPSQQIKSHQRRALVLTYLTRELPDALPALITIDIYVRDFDVSFLLTVPDICSLI